MAAPASDPLAEQLLADLVVAVGRSAAIAAREMGHPHTAAESWYEGMVLGLVLAAHAPKWAGLLLEQVAANDPHQLVPLARMAVEALVARGERLEEAHA